MTRGQNVGPNRGQNERLRALLKEARVLHGCHGVCVLECIWSRIDAALAEPVEVHPSSLSDVVTLLENERDEARAEVQFLRGVGCNELDGTDVRGPCGACLKCARRERDEARAALADAYRRGAEAMREAAAATVGSNAGCSHMVCGYCPSSAEKIRALPIPEDKP